MFVFSVFAIPDDSLAVTGLTKLVNDQTLDGILVITASFDQSGAEHCSDHLS